MFTELLLATTLGLLDDTSSTDLPRSGQCVIQTNPHSTDAVCTYSIVDLNKKIVALVNLSDTDVGSKGFSQTFGLPEFSVFPDNCCKVLDIKVGDGKDFAHAMFELSSWIPHPKEWVPVRLSANAPPPTAEHRMRLSLSEANPPNCLSFKKLRSAAIRFGWRGKMHTFQVSEGFPVDILELHRSRSLISVREDSDGCVRDLDRTIKFDPASARRLKDR